MRINHCPRLSNPRCGRLARVRPPKGVALILVMLAMLVLSVLAASIVFTARSETFASYNYKLDTQADYLAKAGVQRTVNWLRSSGYRAASPTQALANYQVTSTGAPFNLYIANTSPVKCLAAGSTCPAAGAYVELIGYGSGVGGSSTSNYPAGITNGAGTVVATAFGSALNDTSYVNNRISGDAANSGYFKVKATLLNYQTVNVTPAPTDPNVLASCTTLGTIVTCPVETWLVTAKATWTGASAATATVATAEEVAIVQPIYWPTWGNALYGFCSVSMTGSAGTCTDAFNSALGPYAGGNGSVASGLCDQTTNANVISSGAGVGANGGVTLGSNVTVGGNVTLGSNPTSGCGASGYSGSSSSVLGEVINGPHVNPPATPIFPSGFPGTAGGVNLTGSSTQAAPDTIAAWTPSVIWPVVPPSGNPPLATSGFYCMTGLTCNGSAPNSVTGAGPYMLNTIKMTGSGALSLVGGTSPLNPVYYDINCINMTGGSIFISGYVVLNVLGSSSCTGSNGMTLTGNGISNGIACTAPCTNIPPVALTINYAGSTKGVSIGGNGAIAGVLNAPLANVTLGGGGANGYMVGSIQANNITVSGGYPIHYDVQLGRVGGSLGTMVSTAYGRKKM